ncbi:MAG: c-type cytochrome [Alphaproteobacteria bacterium]
MSLAAACSGCHAGFAEGIVSLDGMDAETIAASLLSYKAAADGTSVMHRLARGYSEEDVRAIAAFLAAGEGR